MGLGRMVARLLVVFTLFLAAAGLVTGCSGSDSEKAVKKTVEDMSGKTQIDTGNMIKKQLNDLNDYQVKKVQRESGRPAGEDVGDQEQDK